MGRSAYKIILFKKYNNNYENDFRKCSGQMTETAFSKEYIDYN